MTDDKRLDRALVSGIAWTAVLRWGAQLASWIATAFAARLLTPGDYGIIAMATIGIGLLRMVEDFGLDAILVQDRSIAGVQQARLAGLVVAIGVTFCAVFLALAQPIAIFFREPQVAWAVAGLSVLCVTDALQVVPRAMLQRQLEFRRFAMIAPVQVLATQSVLLVAAASGWGFWALITSSIAGAGAVTAVLVVWRPYAVAWPRELGTLASPLRQGWRVLAGRIAYYGLTFADQTIIGRGLGKDALGAYSFATTFANVPSQEVTSIVSRVIPGVFSEVQHLPGELRRYFLILTEFISYSALPLAVGIALTADLIVALVLGPQWQVVVLPLRILCLFSVFSASQVVVAHILMWTGQFRAMMWCTVFAAAVMPLAFLLAVGYGLAAVAGVWVIVYPLVNIPPLLIAFRTISVSFMDWGGALKPALIGCLAMAIGVLALRASLPDSLSLSLQCAAAVGGGAAVYCAVLWLGFRPRLRSMLQLAQTLRSA